MIADGILDMAFAPIERMAPATAMVVVSLAAAVLLLLIFRIASPGERLRRAKARLLAEVLAIRLFPEDPRVTLSCLGRVIVANFSYLRFLAVPLAVAAIPLVLLILELDLRFSREPLRPGEAATVGAVLESGSALSDVRLDAPAGVAVETPALRIPSLAEVDWRVRALENGVHDLRVAGPGGELTKEVVVGEGLSRIATSRDRAGWIRRLLEPGERPFSPGAGFASITVDYPPRRFEILGVRIHWLAAFSILSLLFAFILRKPFGVEI